MFRKSILAGALGLGAMALASTGASAQSFHHSAPFGGYGGGYHGGHHGYYGHNGLGNGFWPAAVAVGALTGALGAIAPGFDEGYGYDDGPYPAYPAAYPVPAPYAYGYPVYGAYPVTYAPGYVGRAYYAPRRFAHGYHHAFQRHGYAPRGGMRGGMMQAGYRTHHR